jgi:hypothetical protein
MTPSDITRLRLHNHRIASGYADAPAKVVGWLGAVQAQDYAGTLWAVGLRTAAATEAEVERALTDGAILRTHFLRPTWHLVAPEDIRWLLALTGPRVRATCGTRHREWGMDDAYFAGTAAVLTDALRGGRAKTRAELGDALAQAGIPSDAAKLNHIAMEAEVSGLVCSGARRGKQTTYALLDERLPASPEPKPFDRAEAVAELTLRYFLSHGPATTRDFVWWSGLTVADARAGIEAAGPRLASETVDGQTYWLPPPPTNPPPAAHDAYLLPPFDEFLISYADRSAALDPRHQSAWTAGNGVFASTVVADGQVIGFWKRTPKRGTVAVTVSLFAPPDDATREAISAAADRYAAFLGLRAALTLTG